MDQIAKGRVLVCGSHTSRDRAYVMETLDRLDAERGPFQLIIEGEAPGVDSFARDWALARGRRVLGTKAEWSRWGKAAGAIRNTAQLKAGNPDLGIAFPGGPGTADMVAKMDAAGVEVINIPPRSRQAVG